MLMYTVVAVFIQYINTDTADCSLPNQEVLLFGFCTSLQHIKRYQTKVQLEGAVETVTSELH